MKKYITLFSIIIILVVLVFVVTSRKEPLKIGYVSGTTGSLSEVGVDGRNSFLLKIKETNEAGGINGHMIETIIKDDENNPELVPLVHDAFDDEGVHFIVGHIISALDSAVLEEAKDDNKLILSASMSSALMDGIDDNFIRLASSYTGQVYHINDYMEDVDHIQSLSVIYDLRNATYTEGFYKVLSSVFEGDIYGYPINADDEVADIILNQIASQPTDGILLLSPASVTSQACQIMPNHDIDMEKYSFSWSMTNDLFEDGGNTVEGLKLVYVHYAEDYEGKYDAFRRRFIEEYDYEPSSICYNTYEMTSLLIESLEATDSFEPEVIKDYILNNSFDGLLGSISIDSYGDRIQTFAMFEVQDGEFIVID